MFNNYVLLNQFKERKNYFLLMKKCWPEIPTYIRMIFQIYVYFCLKKIKSIFKKIVDPQNIFGHRYMKLLIYYIKIVYMFVYWTIGNKSYYKCHFIFVKKKEKLTKQNNKSMNWIWLYIKLFIFLGFLRI